MRNRGAESPRSASPMGPAPTRLPRMALPLATDVLPGFFSATRRAAKAKCMDGTGGTRRSFPEPARRPAVSELALQQESERNDRYRPYHADEIRDAVEIALHDRRATEGRGHAATEHVGQAAALPLVQEDQQHQQEAGNDQHQREQNDHDRFQIFVG